MNPYLPTAHTTDTDWRLQALCRQVDPELFFPEGEHPIITARKAKSICQPCPVQFECLEYALTNNETFGVWGGMTARERRDLPYKDTPHPRRMPQRARVHAGEHPRQPEWNPALQDMRQRLRAGAESAAASGGGRMNPARLARVDQAVAEVRQVQDTIIGELQVRLAGIDEDPTLTEAGTIAMLCRECETNAALRDAVVAGYVHLLLERVKTSGGHWDTRSS